MRYLLLSLIFSFQLIGSAKPDVLFFSGSTRKGSVNKKLIWEAARLAEADGASVTVIDLKHYPMPFYDGDVELEKGMPKRARAFRQELLEHKIIVISTPEYNGSTSAVLKNAIDWASRTPQKQGSREAFNGKTFVLMSASPSSQGGSQGLEQLEKVITKLGGKICSADYSLANADEAFDASGHLKNPKLKQELSSRIRDAISGKCPGQTSI